MINVQTLTIDDLNQAHYCCMGSSEAVKPGDSNWEELASEALCYIQQADSIMLDMGDTYISVLIGIRAYVVYLKPQPKGTRVTSTGRKLSLVR